MEDELLKMQIAALKQFNARAATLERQCDGYMASPATITLRMSHDKETGRLQCRASGTLKCHVTVFTTL